MCVGETRDPGDNGLAQPGTSKSQMKSFHACNVTNKLVARLLASFVIWVSIMEVCLLKL